MLAINLKKKKKIDKIELIESQNRLGKFSLVIQDEPKGLGHAVCCASNFFNENQSFAVILPDDLILSKTPAIKQLIEVHKKTNGGSVIGLEKVPIDKVSNYGVIKYNKKNKNFFTVSDVVEKPKKSEAPSNLSIVGRYILNSKIFQFLKLGKKGFGNEIQLTDSLISLINTPGLYASEFDGKRFDCGSKLGFIEANINFGINDKEINKNLRKIISKL